MTLNQFFYQDTLNWTEILGRWRLSKIKYPREQLRPSYLILRFFLFEQTSRPRLFCFQCGRIWNHTNFVDKQSWSCSWHQNFTKKTIAGEMYMQTDLCLYSYLVPTCLLALNLKNLPPSFVFSSRLGGHRWKKESCAALYSFLCQEYYHKLAKYID